MSSAVAAAISLALCALFASGCGASALERHTMAASAFHAAAEISADVIDTEARSAVAGLSDPEEVRAAIERRRPLEAAQHVFAASVDGYVTALLLAARDERPDMAAVRVAGLRVIDVYEQVRRLAHELGVELPSLAPFVLALMGGE